ncbi:MAG: Zn-dependent exopeptidase M28, partial [Prolixibacteraceae bacterium]|nr:Zn-dependent exopeptidase M28 [Prolixibacteraceae bacterium]
MNELLEIKKRSNRSEKDEFLNIVEGKLKNLGYCTQRKELGDIITKVNLYTKCKDPEYIFIAHYDTGKILPFWFNWLFQIFGINRQLLFIPLMLAWSDYFMPWLSSIQETAASTLSAILGFSFFSILFPNPKNYDDNTSGVIALLYIAEYLKGKGDDNVQFIFVDKEESGLFGSLAQKKEMRRNGELQKSPQIISIDCVGGKGKLPLIVRNSKSKYAKYYCSLLENEFGSCKSIRTL